MVRLSSVDDSPEAHDTSAMAWTWRYAWRALFIGGAALGAGGLLGACGDDDCGYDGARCGSSDDCCSGLTCRESAITSDMVRR